MKSSQRLGTIHVALLILFAVGAARCGCGEEFIVKDGKPHAEIVVAKKPAGAIDLAARELQTYIEKISGFHDVMKFGKLYVR